MMEWERRGSAKKLGVLRESDQTISKSRQAQDFEAKIRERGGLLDLVGVLPRGTVRFPFREEPLARFDRMFHDAAHARVSKSQVAKRSVLPPLFPVGRNHVRSE